MIVGQCVMWCLTPTLTAVHIKTDCIVWQVLYQHTYITTCRLQIWIQYVTKAWGELATRPAARYQKGPKWNWDISVCHFTKFRTLFSHQVGWWGCVNWTTSISGMTFSEPKNLSSSHNLGIIIPRYENVTLKLEIVCVSSSNQREK